jgi:tetratricopeptide (TPR) repeat protein
MTFRRYFVLLLTIAFHTWLTAQSNDLQHLESHLPPKRDTARVNALNRLSWGYRRVDSDKALTYGERATWLSKELHYWPGLASSYKNRGAVYSVKGDFVKARTYLKKAMLQFSELRNRMETGNLHNLLGLLYWENGNYDSAGVYYKNALKLYREIGDEEGKGIVYSNMGIISYETGNYDDALGYYSKALTIGEKRGDVATLASVHTNIGLIYGALGNYRKALSHHRQSVQFEKQSLNNSGMARSYTNLGVCHYNLKDKDSSLFYHRKALKLYESVGEKRGVAHSLLNIGSLFLDRGEYAASEAHLLRALDIKREIRDGLGEVIALDFLGKLRIAEGKEAEAAKLLEEAYVKAYRMRSLRYQVETSQALAQLYDAMGRSDEAMRYYKIHSAANDSLLREKASNKLTDLQIGLATKDKQREVDHWKTQWSMADHKIGLIVCGSIFLLAVIGFVVIRLRFRHKKEKARLEAELATNRAALLAYTQQLLERAPAPLRQESAMADEDETATSVSAKAVRKELRSESEDETATSVSAKAVREELQTVAERILTDEDVAVIHELSGARIITDDDWEEFKKLFNRVYPYGPAVSRASAP